MSLITLFYSVDKYIFNKVIKKNIKTNVFIKNEVF